MHEATQRRLLRYSFLLFCVLPTLGVIGWSVAWSLPGHTASLERQLRHQLGVVIRLDGVTHLRPGAVRLDHVQLIDPETRQCLAEVASVKATRVDGTLYLAASNASLIHDQWQRLWRLLHDRVLCQDVLEGRSARFMCNELVVKSSEADFLLVKLDGSIRHEQTSLRADLSCSWQLADETVSPLELSVFRQRNTARPHTEVSINTQSHLVPLGLLPPAVRQRFSDQTRFAGTFRCILNDLFWNGQIHGQLKNVDLKQLVAPECPHHLDVSTDIDQLHAEFGADGLKRAAGGCVADGGTVGRDLLLSLINHHLGSAGAALSASSASDQPLPIRRLALDWQIDEQGLAITGTCSSAESPTEQIAILGEAGPLWNGPWHRVVHLEYFVRALVPPELQNASAVARRLQYRLPRPAPTLDRPPGTR